jgi:hypothetical protein
VEFENENAVREAFPLLRRATNLKAALGVLGFGLETVNGGRFVVTQYGQQPHAGRDIDKRPRSRSPQAPQDE